MGQEGQVGLWSALLLNQNSHSVNESVSNQGKYRVTGAAKKAGSKLEHLIMQKAP